mgnify:FL=1
MAPGLPAFNTIDYVLLLILVLCALTGLKQGFVMTVGGIVTFVLSIVLAIFYYDDLSVYLDSNVGITSKLDQFLSEHTPLKTLGIPYNLMVKGLTIEEAVHNLAYWLVRALCFVLIALTSRQLLWLALGWLEKLINLGPGSAVNRLLGTVLAVLQGVVVLTLVFWFTLPVLEAASAVGIEEAGLLQDYMNQSVLVTWMRAAYDWGQHTLGLEV